jgi:hypothetical protein
MFLGKAYVFIHVEGYYILETNLTLLMQADEFFISAEWSATSGEAQYERLLGCGTEFVDSLYDVSGSPNCHLLWIFLDD